MEENLNGQQMNEKRGPTSENTETAEEDCDWRRTGRSRLCTDVDGGSRDLSNGRHTEKQCSDLHGTSCYYWQEFMRALTLYYWLGTVRVYTAMHAYVRVHTPACLRVLPFMCDSLFVSMNVWYIFQYVCGIEGVPFIAHITVFSFLHSPPPLILQSHLCWLSVGTPLDLALCYLILEK